MTDVSEGRVHQVYWCTLPHLTSLYCLDIFQRKEDKTLQYKSTFCADRLMYWCILKVITRGSKSCICRNLARLIRPENVQLVSAKSLKNWNKKMQLTSLNVELIHYGFAEVYFTDTREAEKSPSCLDLHNCI